MATKKIQTFVFYYKATVHSQRVVIKTQNCKIPTRTKVWKKLIKMMNNNECVGYGCELKKENKSFSFKM